MPRRSTDLGDFLAAFDLVQGVDDLFVAAAFARHSVARLAGRAGLFRTPQIVRVLPFRCTDFWVLGRFVLTMMFSGMASAS
jgi:hypothetical protein